MSKETLFLLITISVLSACNTESNSNDVKEIISGEELFKNNCAQCHINADTGPTLKNVADRWNNKTLLYEFIRNPQTVIARDPYAKALYEKWGSRFMQPSSHLSNEEIDRILNYCDSIHK